MPWVDFGTGVYSHLNGDRSMTDYGPGKVNVPKPVSDAAVKRGKGTLSGKPHVESDNGEG